jgi:hypothetical protein
MNPDQRTDNHLADDQLEPNGAVQEDSQSRTADLTTAPVPEHGHDQFVDAPPLAVDDGAGSPAADDDESPVLLFEPEAAERFRVEWLQIQTRFVDDPKDAVQGADHLLAEVLESLAGTFTERKHELEGQWHGESEALTEDLRLALRRYRTFFNQLLDA